MGSKSEGPDAWEDDWESQADKLADQPTPPPSEKKVSSKVTKAQRRAQQAEFNRQLWEEAETPQTFHFVEARSEVPLKQDFKPAVKLLSRRPQIATRQSSSLSGADGVATGLGRLGLDNEDSDEESNKRPEPTPEERQAIALKNREEKQRKYEEVRERLFGSPSANTSGTSSPGSTTPPRQSQSGEGRGKGKARGGGAGREYREKRDSSTASNKSRHLYDPSTSIKTNGSSQQRRERQPGNQNNQNNQNNQDKQFAPQQPSRSPRGPDGSGRGGFGFGNRGARAS